MSSPSRSSSDFGYLFEPPAVADQPRHRKLTVVLRAAPTQAHFDPDKIDCRVVSAQGDLDHLVLAHPWPLANEYRLAAGRIRISDRRSHKVEAFTFGGRLRIDASADQTTCVFESPAPILALLAENPFLNRVAAHAEGLLAQRQALWDSRGQPDQFETRLAQADPQALYQACLAELLQALSHGRVLGGASDQELQRFLAAEHRPGAGPSLADML